MTPSVRHPNRDRWLTAIFAAQAARKGGVVRRSGAWVDLEIGTDALVAEVSRRGFDMIETGGQYVVICNHGTFRVTC